MMGQPFDGVIKEIDAGNASDPRTELVGGAQHPVELIYSERMTQCLSDLYPAASEALQIAARGQHICRWQIPRASYPLGRDGYNAWRAACREHHAALVGAILERHGYPASMCRRVGDLIKKRHLKTDPESQALENVVGVVFVSYYLADFVRKNAHHGDEKLIGILRKTLRKMDETGVEALKRLTVPGDLIRLLAAAFTPADNSSS